MTDEEKDELVKELVLMARQIFPNQTAEAEAWIDRQVKSYGFSYVKMRTAEAWDLYSVNPLIWLAAGAAIFWMVKK